MKIGLRIAFYTVCSLMVTTLNIVMMSSQSVHFSSDHNSHSVSLNHVQDSYSHSHSEDKPIHKHHFHDCGFEHHYTVGDAIFILLSIRDNRPLIDRPIWDFNFLEERFRPPISINNFDSSKSLPI